MGMKVPGVSLITAAKRLKEETPRSGFFSAAALSLNHLKHIAEFRFEPGAAKSGGNNRNQRETTESAVSPQ